MAETPSGSRGVACAMTGCTPGRSSEHIVGLALLRIGIPPDAIASHREYRVHLQAPVPEDEDREVTASVLAVTIPPME